MSYFGDDAKANYFLWSYMCSSSLTNSNIFSTSVHHLPKSFFVTSQRKQNRKSTEQDQHSSATLNGLAVPGAFLSVPSSHANCDQGDALVSLRQTLSCCSTNTPTNWKKKGKKLI
ncbi:hypothetical protein E2C01_051138 [Portunus trituberculatus]|uniref:Uncharacterized protein n=1 Tax=Portunus trituberculatus TaxID=210409 RepID=A0A5B7GI97_PORTR|nr:hypothetical protein [Portunus trituberculatus]